MTKRIDVNIDDGLYDRMLTLAGLARSHGWLSDMVVAALDAWCISHELPAPVDAEDTWFEQMMKKHMPKPRRRAP
jgi:hypothetical protein